MPAELRRVTLVFATFVFALLPSRPAGAVDGVIEINQARALAGGVTVGDLAGFPVDINASGSYRLTGNLTLPNANTTAIQIASGAKDVSIDLNGFSIIGPCFGACGGSGFGIITSASFGTDCTLHIANGIIQGTGDVGIYSNCRASIQSVQVVTNSASGIVVEASATVLDSVARGNGERGILVDLPGSVIRGCSALGNGSDGIVAVAGSLIVANTSSFNGGAGISVTTGSTVLDNSAINNVGFGLNFAVGTGGYARNVFTGNNGGDANPQVAGAGIQTGTNVCGGAVCP